MQDILLESGDKITKNNVVHYFLTSPRTITTLFTRLVISLPTNSNKMSRG